MYEPPNLKYAHVEDERRYLLRGVPEGWQEVPAIEILDRYISGTRLRLRSVRAAGGQMSWKLGQKIRLDPVFPSRVAHTTIYLDEGEAATLASLPAVELLKLRRTRRVGGHLWVVDQFRGSLKGLFTAEVDLGDKGVMSEHPPFAVVTEITGDDRYSGSHLAQLSSEAVFGLIAESGL